MKIEIIVELKKARIFFSESQVGKLRTSNQKAKDLINWSTVNTEKPF
ncbi:hypothetical protein FH581_024460 [Leptospira weilii]|nr:hypothetical protein [Leptospira weilii]UPY78293.1 hypothetical protein FH581_024460 [Leptospira weilii]